MIVIDAVRCPQNHPCPSVKLCPTGAISQENNTGLPAIDIAKCTECGQCIVFCPMKAISKQ